ncbi:hypothetical protein [Arthrobacter sp. Y-9]|uniref:DUF7927 domain-containing protein n=1 Tax=Arthrobacter sp. Y-9 TaxID=3039385 RepID=UPI00241C1614|nr:hypothetical protein [Arthrobacter sp. Y-9]WFR84295.1 hypothetical protein P9849_01215 [Arthrobacter sp. Y-9]
MSESSLSTKQDRTTTHGGHRRTLAGLMLLLPTLLVLVFQGGAGISKASAAPQQLVEPQAWTVAGTTAIGRTAEGVTVSASYSGPGKLSSESHRLRIDLTGCTAACGALTYTFSAPVATPRLTVADIGAARVNPSRIITAYHDHPITVRDASFIPVNATPDLGLWNSNRTLGVLNPRQFIGAKAAPPGSCSNFGCGTFDLQLQQRTVSQIAFNFGYAGTGTNRDVFWLDLAFVPAPATVQVGVSAEGQAGMFRFTTSNLSHAAQSITTRESGLATTATPSTVLNYAQAASVTQLTPKGFGLSQVSCIDSNSTLSGNPSNVPFTLRGTTISIAPRYLTGDAAIRCTFGNEATQPSPGTPSQTPNRPTPAPSEPTPAPSITTRPLPVPQPPMDSCVADCVDTTFHADPPSGTSVKAEQTVHYTATFTNSAITPVHIAQGIDLRGVLDDAVYLPALQTAPENWEVHASATTLDVLGTLAPGESKQVSFAVKVHPSPAGDHTLVAAFTAGGTHPAGAKPAQCRSGSACAAHPVSAFTLMISGPAQAEAQNTATFTVDAVNSGKGPASGTAVIDLSGILPGATYRGDAPATVAYQESRLLWQVSLPPQGRRSFTFSVTTGTSGGTLIGRVVGGENCPAAASSSCQATITTAHAAPTLSVFSVPVLSHVVNVRWSLVMGGLTLIFIAALLLAAVRPVWGGRR